jgi:transcription termination factor Rho
MVSMITSDTMKDSEATEKVLDRLRKTKSNHEFLSTLGKSGGSPPS